MTDQAALRNLADLNARALRVIELREWLYHPDPEVRLTASRELERRGLDGTIPDIPDEDLAHCDLCGQEQDLTMDGRENDWNGETGNHISCEFWREALIDRAIHKGPHCSRCTAIGYRNLATDEWYHTREAAIRELPLATECCGVPFLTPCKPGCDNWKERAR